MPSNSITDLRPGIQTGGGQKAHARRAAGCAARISGGRPLPPRDAAFRRSEKPLFFLCPRAYTEGINAREEVIWTEDTAWAACRRRRNSGRRAARLIPPPCPAAWAALEEAPIDKFPWDENGYRPPAAARVGWNERGLHVLLYADEPRIRAEGDGLRRPRLSGQLPGVFSCAQSAAACMVLEHRMHPAPGGALGRGRRTAWAHGVPDDTGRRQAFGQPARGALVGGAVYPARRPCLRGASA